MKDLKQKILKSIEMFEIIYSNKDKLNVGIVRLWRLKKLRDKVRNYLPILDMKDPKYVTKEMLRNIDYVYLVFKTILEEKLEEKQ